jgi:hypothetical protein
MIGIMPTHDAYGTSMSSWHVTSGPHVQLCCENAVDSVDLQHSSAAASQQCGVATFRALGLPHS